MKARKSRATGKISFLPVAPRPCDRVIDGTVVAKVVVPALEEPIGWIVSSPAGEGPDGPPKPTEAKLWHFVPACPIEPVLFGGSGQIALYDAVRQQYHRVYDFLATDQPRWIANGDDCEIEGMVLEWTGMTELWDELDIWDFSFHSEVMDACDSAIIDSRIWSGGGPGLSGVWYVVLSTNRALLHKELRNGIYAVILRTQE